MPRFLVLSVLSALSAATSLPAQQVAFLPHDINPAAEYPACGVMDVNHDGKLWTDKDHDGVVDKVASSQTNIDGDPLIDYPRSEIEKGEYVRFAYNNPSSNSYMVQVRDPKARLLLPHRERSERQDAGRRDEFPHGSPDSLERDLRAM